MHFFMLAFAVSELIIFNFFTLEMKVKVMKYNIMKYNILNGVNGAIRWEYQHL